MTQTEIAEGWDAKLRRDPRSDGSSPRFEAARRWRPWRELTGLLAPAIGLALWLVLVIAVARPLGASLARLDAFDRAAPQDAAAAAAARGAGRPPMAAGAPAPLAKGTGS